MSDLSHCDVAVIGYGPTGATAANLLGRLGLNVVVVERDPDIYRRARAISTDEEVLRIWQKAGLADRLSADMLPGGPVSFLDSRGRTFVELAPPAHGSGHPPQQFIYQPALERALRDGVDRCPDVQVLLEHECVRVRQDTAGAELLIADLRTDRFVRLRASYVIAADGGSSPIRGHLGIGYEGRTYSERWVVIDTKVIEPWPGHDRLRFHCNPDRPTVDCPTPLGHHRWEFPVWDDEDEDELVTESAIHRILQAQGVPSDRVEILRAVVYSHHVRFADRWRVGRVFLAGDAAHAMPPWIGQGMSAGVRDAANLCWKLAAVVNGILPESILDTYQRERLPHVREVTERAVKVGRIITERNRARATLRDTGFRIALRIPGFTDRMLRTRWIPAPFHPEGLLAVPRATAGRATGHLVPQPWVLDPTGARVRLDDALGGRWTILHLGAAEPWPAWSAVDAPTLRLAPPHGRSGPQTLVDVDGSLVRWMHEKKAVALALRPDGVVYAAAGPDTPLPPPPAGMRPIVAANRTTDTNRTTESRTTV